VGATEAAMPAVRPGTHVGATRKLTSKLDEAIVRTQAKAALTGLGWKPAIAHAAVAAAVAAEGTEIALDRLIIEALRRCPVPRA
jgi:Holliday junction resolvasome RuvABC DNA-binding subunit